MPDWYKIKDGHWINLNNLVQFYMYNIEERSGLIKYYIVFNNNSISEISEQELWIEYKDCKERNAAYKELVEHIMKGRK